MTHVPTVSSVDLSVSAWTAAVASLHELVSPPSYLIASAWPGHSSLRSRCVVHVYRTPAPHSYLILLWGQGNTVACGLRPGRFYGSSSNIFPWTSCIYRVGVILFVWYTVLLWSDHDYLFLLTMFPFRFYLRQLLCGTCFPRSYFDIFLHVSSLR
jgi:hypothetical protein